MSYMGDDLKGDLLDNRQPPDSLRLQSKHRGRSQTLFLLLRLCLFFSFAARSSTGCTTWWATCTSTRTASPSNASTVRASSRWRGTSPGTWKSSTASWTEGWTNDVRMPQNIYIYNIKNILQNWMRNRLFDTFSGLMICVKFPGVEDLCEILDPPLLCEIGIEKKNSHKWFLMFLPGLTNVALN